MPKKPTDALLSFLFHDIDDLTSPHPLLLNRLASEFGEAKIRALLEQKLLKLAGYQTTFECPEDCLERCVLSVERDEDGRLFGYCNREDIAVIPINKEDLKACVPDFHSIADFVAQTLGRELQRNETPGKFLTCYLNGSELNIEAGGPVNLCIDDNKCALAEAIAWTGTRFAVQPEEIWGLVPSARGHGGAIRTVPQALQGIKKTIFQNGRPLQIHGAGKQRKPEQRPTDHHGRKEEVREPQV